MDKLLDLLFPKFCLGCHKEGNFICQDCKSLLDILEFNYCLCDANQKRTPLSAYSDQKTGKCSNCKNKALSGLYFALNYKEKFLVKKLIRQFKYKPFLKELAEPLAQILTEHFIKTGKNTDEIWENSVLIPVPLHIKKLKERGYNQSELLSYELSKIVKIPVLPNVLIKTKNTSSQMELKKQEREKNLAGAFTVNQNCVSPGLTQFSKIFLVDDVYTTGSTMQECALALLRAGAKSVWGITIARES